MYILFLLFLPSCCITNDWISFPVLYSRTSLLIHSKSNSLHLLTPNFPSILLSPPFLGSRLLLFMYVCIFGLRQLSQGGGSAKYDQDGGRCTHAFPICDGFWHFKGWACLVGVGRSLATGPVYPGKPKRTEFSAAAQRSDVGCVCKMSLRK